MKLLSSTFTLLIYAQSKAAACQDFSVLHLQFYLLFSPPSLQMSHVPLILFFAPFFTLCIVPQVPVIDISRIMGSQEEAGKVTKEIGNACEKWGFFQVVGHGVPTGKTKQFLESTREFFDLPTDQKMSCKRLGVWARPAHPAIVKAGLFDFQKDACVRAYDAVRHIKTLYPVYRTQDNSRGWYDNELTKQKRDWKQGFDFGCQNGGLNLSGLDGFNQWPDEALVPNFRRVQEDYFLALESMIHQWRMSCPRILSRARTYTPLLLFFPLVEVAEKLCMVIADSLGVHKSFFAE